MKCFLPHGDGGEERRHADGVSLIWKLSPNTAEKASTRNGLEKNPSASYHILEKETQDISLEKKKKEVKKYSRDK